MTGQGRNPPDTDAEAVAAIVSRLRGRPEGADDEWVARDMLAALKMLGYRLTLAMAPPDWKTPREDKADDYARGAELWRTAYADRATGPQPVLREGHDP